MSKIQVYIGSRNGLVNSPSGKLYTYEWKDLPIETSSDEIIRSVRVGIDDNGEPFEILPVVHYEKINVLLGQVLTLIDATFSDPEQRKAFKDILREKIWAWYHDQQVG